ncbi:MAG: hypothetical protein PHU43_10305 [Candidatus Bipolaricaulis sp.]|nr:hypothetical protein [Candidatus Bipolaricaulis sp.]
MTYPIDPPKRRAIGLCLAWFGVAGCFSLAVCARIELGAAGEAAMNAVARSSASAVGWTANWAPPATESGALSVAAGQSRTASFVRLPTEEELRRRIAGGGEHLRATWRTVEAALDSIRALPCPATPRAIETCLEVLAKSVDACHVQAMHEVFARADAAVLLSALGELALHADQLESIASRVRLYCKGTSAATLAGALRDSVQALADGRAQRYRAELLRIGCAADAARGGDLRRDAADSIGMSCDKLIRRIAVVAVERSLKVAWAAEALGVNLDAEFAAARASVKAPSGGTRSLSAAGATAYESGDTEIVFSFSANAAQVDDRLRKDAAQATSQVEASAAWRLGEIDLEARIAAERERRPLQIDAEIEGDNIPGAQGVVEMLAQEVAAEALASATRRLLLADLSAAEAALEEGRRGDAADAIEDFIGHVESERWKGYVPAAAAARWTEMATELQPRRSVRRLEIPFAAEIPVGNGSVDLELEWSTTAYPANAVLSATKSSARATWSTERDGWSIDTSAERTGTRYPAASAKDTSTSELAAELDRPLVVGDLAIATKVARQARPTAPENDRDDTTVSGSWSGTWSGFSWTLEGSEKLRRYPNDPSHLGTRTRASALDAAFPLAGGTLGVAWETEEIRTSDGDSSQDATTLSIAWEYSAGDVEAALSADWLHHTDGTSPAKDQRSLKLAAEFSIEF